MTIGVNWMGNTFLFEMILVFSSRVVYRVYLSSTRVNYSLLGTISGNGGKVQHVRCVISNN